MKEIQENWRNFIIGIGFTFLIAGFGYLIALAPIFNRIGPLASAIILAIIYRQIFGYPEKFKTGIGFSSKYILRLAIILYGLKLNIHIIFQDGVGLLLKSVFIITFSILMMIIIGKLLKADQQLTFLLGVGTGICGAAAIAATAPIIKAKEEETAISIAIIALMGTIFSIIYTILMPLLPLSSISYGVWSGLSLHELAHVALAAEPAGENELAIALLAKLTRVFLLIPFCFILVVWLKSRRNNDKNIQAKMPFPYFLIGFIVMSIFGSYVLGSYIVISDQTLAFISNITTFLLTSAMVGLGLNVSLQAIRTKALKPLMTIIVVSLALSLVSYFIVLI